jgi:hypothetical protein
MPGRHMTHLKNIILFMLPVLLYLLHREKGKRENNIEQFALNDFTLSTSPTLSTVIPIYDLWKRFDKSIERHQLQMRQREKT